MRKIIRKMILILLLTGVVLLPSAVFGETVRVGLKYGSSAENAYVLSSPTGFVVGTISASGFEEVLPISAYGEAKLVLESGIVNLYSADGNLLLQNFGDSVIAPMDHEEEGKIRVSGREYRGAFTVSANASGTLNLINVIDLEAYVYGVLNGEMNCGNPKEALKAQAVCARSFAETNHNRHAQYGFDVCAGTHCQVYKGYSDEHAETNQATDETAGLCLIYEGSTVSAYYFKNSGGHTQNSEDVWGGRLGYLRGVSDPYSPNYPWNASFSFDSLEKKLEAAGKSVGTLTSVEITSRNSSGAVRNVTFRGTAGNVSFSGEELRSLLGSSVIRSTMFSFAGASRSTERNGSGGSSAEISLIHAVGNGTSAVLTKDENAAVIGSSGNIEYKSIHGLYAASASRVSVLFAENESAESSAGNQGAESVTEGPVVFEGNGYGHGIGMPQDSAIEMAKQGFTFREILEYYYTDIEIR